MTEERPNKVILDVNTGEETILPLTDEEWEEMKVMRAEAEARRLAEEAAAQAKAEAKASAIAKLAALGLTEEEAAAIAGA